ncbi:Putative glycosyl/glycerophosphate transferase [Nitrosotalea devaniterrae]|uniref:Glycosyl/glycerophosphate transferase n=1 Tax=Nitrosotalea devaniterrae TaxID=1078905 RepID=A0A128A0V6_9ARCH|nr:Putative glycosyl/glycerophosphate transferase [Candidatus Nitrosotalea devanaterra]
METISEQYQIITSNTQMFDFLNSLGKKVVKLNDVIPEEGPKWEEVVKIAKDIHEKYKIALQNIRFNNMTIFEGYEYQIFLQLAFLIRIRKIIEDKTSTIFILDTLFSSVYFSILRFAESLGYSIQMKIGVIKGDQIEYHGEEFDQNTSEYRRKMFVSKQRQILKHSFGSGLSYSKFKMYYKFASRIFTFLVHSTSYKFQHHLQVDVIKKILDRVDKKILDDVPYEAMCCFFVSAIREDLYIRPLYPIMDKLVEDKDHFHIITADLSTGLVLSKSKRPFINIFEEFNIIYQEIKNNEIGHDTKNQINKIANSQSTVFAFKDFTSELIEKSFRTIAIMIICDHVIAKMQVKSIVIAPTGEIFENTITEIAKKHSIQSISIPPGLVDSNPFYSKWLKVDKICVPGIQAKEALTKLGYEENRIIVTGNPKYDYIKHLDSTKSKIKLEEILKVTKNKKLVVIGMSRWHETDELWMSELIGFCNENNFEIIIKIHPLYRIESEYSHNKIEKISQKCKGLRYFMVQDIDLTMLLSAADVLITDYSSIGLEAIFHEKPLISVNISKEKWEDYPSRVEKYGASFYTENYNELENILKQILVEGKHAESLKKGREEVIRNFNYGNDGKSTDRICNIIRSVD